MAHAIDEPIIEGFICPTCMSVFRTPDILRIHFDKEHSSAISQSRANVSPSSQFKLTEQTTQKFVSHAFFDQPTQSQPLGCLRTWTTEVRQWRAARIARTAAQTNALLLRLEKLICLPPLKRPERREAEQAVVSWIDTKVELCPSCGNRFGLGVEEAFPEEPTTGSIATLTKGKISIADLSKRTLALLDYNPVFRRRHHCRLCGHVLCADCSVFLDRESAVRLVNAIDRHNLDHHSESREQFDPSSSEYQPMVFVREPNESKAFIDLDREPTLASHWRLCKVCKEVVEKKWERLRERYRTSPLVQLHTELKSLMDKVNESMPGYSTIANSLHSGEQRYDLEMAKTMRHELLESLQRIDVLRKQLDTLESNPASGQRHNLAFIRVVRAINNMARQFLQLNLPPLRILPTLQQYGSLTAQRQDELASRWAQEDQTIAELEKCLTSSNNTPSTRTKPSLKAVTVDDLNQLAVRIDTATRRLMFAKRSASPDPQRIAALTAELEALEKQFQTFNQILQRSAKE